jgi:hypothetical protein
MLLAATPVAAAGPTGDPRAIAIYRAAARATNELPAYVITQSGYVRIFDSLGPKRRVHWAWGWDQGQPGYRPATERLVLVQRDGRTAWIEDTLTPTARSCRGGCAVVPIELLITPTAAWDGLVSSSSGTSAGCFVRVATTHAPYVAGGPWWATVGALSAPVRSGRLTEITSRFALASREVRESDWLTTATRLFARSVVQVAPGGGTPGFTYASSDATLARVPRFPSITLCS